MLVVSVRSSVFVCVYFEIFPRVPFFLLKSSFIRTIIYTFIIEIVSKYTLKLLQKVSNHTKRSLSIVSTQAHTHAIAHTTKSENNAQMKRNLSYGIKLCRKSLY